MIKKEWELTPKVRQWLGSRNETDRAKGLRNAQLQHHFNATGEVLAGFPAPADYRLKIERTPDVTPRSLRSPRSSTS